MKNKYTIGPCFVNLKNKQELLDQLFHNLFSQYKETQIYFYANVGSFYYLKAKTFQRAFSQADFSYLNSDFLSYFYNMIFRSKFQKSNAEDFIDDLCLFCQNTRKKIMLLGSTEKTNSRAIVNLHKKYPHLMLRGYHGYFHASDILIQTIQSYKPDLILVGLGYGRQEQWLSDNKKSLNQVKACITIGNYIEIIGGQIKLPPYYFKLTHLEWLYRLIKEPCRLWKRYLFGLFYFSKEIIGFIFKKKDKKHKVT